MLFPLLALLTIGCVTRESFPEDYAAAACEMFDRCGTDLDPAIAADCEDWIAENMGVESYTESPTWDEALAQACIVEIRESDCDRPETPSCRELYDDEV